MKLQAAIAGGKENARAASGPTPQMIWSWVVLWWCFFFLTVMRCPGDQMRRYEEPESISEHSSVVIMSLLPELSWHRRQVNISHCPGKWQCINLQNTLRNNKPFATLPLNSERVRLAWWMAVAPSRILRHSTAPNSLAEVFLSWREGTASCASAPSLAAVETCNFLSKHQHPRQGSWPWARSHSCSVCSCCIHV